MNRAEKLRLYDKFRVYEHKITELEETINKLREQIEKMKCCGKCKYYNHSTKECKITKLFHFYASSCDKWELEEIKE